MCGIWGLFGYDSSDIQHCTSAFKIAHRGPDCYHLQNINKLKNCTLAFHRLCVVDNVRGMQPMRLTQYPHLTLMCNGEIYNFKKLKEEFNFNFETACDIEIILHLYNKFGIEVTGRIRQNSPRLYSTIYAGKEDLPSVALSYDWRRRKHQNVSVLSLLSLVLPKILNKAKKCVALLDGVFALMVLDTQKKKVFLARDTYGVRPMFFFTTDTGMLGFSSEGKGLIDVVNVKNIDCKPKCLQWFPPAHFMQFNISENGKVTYEREERFHAFADRPLHWQYQDIQLNSSDTKETIRANIRHIFTKAVEKRLMTSRRVGSLLSGGLDSSLVAAITAAKLKENDSALPLPTFSIGMGLSPDVLAARKVAKHIGSEHHEISFTAEEGLEAIKEVIYATESFDVTTIRASIPMYLLSKYISENTDTIVIMSGEGADELAQGYIYFHKQRSPEEGDKESRRLLKDLYMYDVLRTDRSTAAHGLEVRAPFLDHAFTSYFLSLPAELRAPTEGIEKHLLRSAFDDEDLLPSDILWRKKEAFSDGVASIKRSWFKILQEHIEDQVTEKELERAVEKFSHCTPETKEGLYYRKIFDQKFGAKMEKLIPYIWLPKWMGDIKDPSARVLSHYHSNESQ